MARCCIMPNGDRVLVDVQGAIGVYVRHGAQQLTTVFPDVAALESTLTALRTAMHFGIIPDATLTDPLCEFAGVSVEKAPATEASGEQESWHDRPPML